MGVNRKSLREAVKATLTTGLGSTVSLVTESLPKKLDGRSPVVTIESGATRLIGTPDEPGWVGLTIGIFVRRDDADAAEDLLDTITDSVIDALDAAYNVTWPNETEPDYIVEAGVVYRVEWHEVSIQWW